MSLEFFHLNRCKSSPVGQESCTGEELVALAFKLPPPQSSDGWICKEAFLIRSVRALAKGLPHPLDERFVFIIVSAELPVWVQEEAEDGLVPVVKLGVDSLNIDEEFSDSCHGRAVFPSVQLHRMDLNVACSDVLPEQPQHMLVEFVAAER